MRVGKRFIGLHGKNFTSNLILRCRGLNANVILLLGISLLFNKCDVKLELGLEGLQCRIVRMF
jgi:hypothetical protein